ncbi:MAG: putative metalloprotease CJM1_0395 family protein [Chitinivibrionales bacterium]|nr:putative metalloprotease CJM1_0395 family protein [Chitinivibrionales bacterium]
MGTSAIDSILPSGLSDYGSPSGASNSPNLSGKASGPGETGSSSAKKPDFTVLGGKDPSKTETSEKSAKKGSKSNELSPEQQKEVDKLKARDAEVHAHEMAHAAVGGQYAGSPSYSYQSGPDGKRYAVGGEVSIDSSAIKDDPQATARKMEVVQRAALAPANPSGQDMAVAAAAAQKEASANLEIAQQQNQNPGGDSSGKTADTSQKSRDKTGQTLRYTLGGQANSPKMVPKQNSSPHINIVA